MLKQHILMSETNLGGSAKTLFSNFYCHCGRKADRLDSFWKIENLNNNLFKIKVKYLCCWVNIYLFDFTEIKAKWLLVRCPFKRSVSFGSVTAVSEDTWRHRGLWQRRAKMAAGRWSSRTPPPPLAVSGSRQVKHQQRPGSARSLGERMPALSATCRGSSPAGARYVRSGLTRRQQRAEGGASPRVSSPVSRYDSEQVGGGRTG